MPCCNLSTGSCVYLGKDETLHPTLGLEGDGVMKRAVLLGLLAAGLLVLSACTPKAPGHVPPSPENPAAQRLMPMLQIKRGKHRMWRNKPAKPFKR